MIKKVGAGVVVVAAASVALAAGGAGADSGGSDGASASGERARTINCTVRLSKQRDPGPGVRGEDFAQITCSRPLGFGAQYDTFTLNPSGTPPSGTGEMRYRAYFDGGRINGTWAVRFAATDQPCDFNFTVTSRWTGGTGAYRNVRGRGSGSGDFTDVENAPNCSKATMRYRMRVTGLPRR